MTEPIELRDPAEARRYVAQGLWWQRIMPARGDAVAAILDWALAIASDGEPLPPIGFVADVGHMVLRAASGLATLDAPPLALPTTITHAYEDSVLGRLFIDSAFERAGDALRAYPIRDRARGLAFLLRQMRARLGFTGVLVSPGTLKSLRDVNADDLLGEGWQALSEQGTMPVLTALMERLVHAFRDAGSTLGAEDIFEIERKTAIAGFGQRVALRQALRAAQMLTEALPRWKPRPRGRRHDVPTRIFEEDTYPVGGFAAISTRGSVESLLHSQLAYMEADDRPDLFDVKFLRDELLYYSRDENSFLRRRRTFVFALYPDLIDARFKDTELPCQRIILLLALVRAAVDRLIDWLHTDSLAFEIVLIGAKDTVPLAAEKELLEVLLAEPIANGTVKLETLSADALAKRCALRARRSLCSCLLASARTQTLDADGVDVSRLTLDAAIPSLGFDRDPAYRPEADSALLGWTAILEQLLQSWI